MAGDDVAQFSQGLSELFQQHAEDFLTAGDNDDVDPPDTGLLMAWSVVCSWQGTDGERWITYHRRPGQTTWETRGLLTEAVADL